MYFYWTWAENYAYNIHLFRIPCYCEVCTHKKKKKEKRKNLVRPLLVWAKVKDSVMILSQLLGRMCRVFYLRITSADRINTYF